MERVIAASRTALGEAWIPAWLEAPVWCFTLPPGICGPDVAIGLWMPSVDSGGRYYPLTLAAVTGVAADHWRLVREAGGFLAAAERAGRDALENKLRPDALSARLAAVAAEPPAAPGVDILTSLPEGGLWWTKGAPRVPATAFASPALPDENTFMCMVDSCISISAELFPHQAP
jgi:type VI secretion system protein ImpM